MYLTSEWTKKDWIDYLASKKMTGDFIKSEMAGEGNMNITLRITLSSGTFIVKQAPPFCAKYPQIPAPIERIQAEAQFFEEAGQSEKLKGFLPKVLLKDFDKSLIVMEDFGECLDFGHLYGEGSLSEEQVKTLTTFLSNLHNNPVTKNFANMSMRQLNSEYIFKLPFQDSLPHVLLQTPGLDEEVEKILKNPAIKKKAEELCAVYLQCSKCLIHGDFYPRSWMQYGDEIRIIDPEFGHVGAPEFDLGILIAHLILTDTHPNLIRTCWLDYQRIEGFDNQTALGFTGAEIIRRLIHIAQLPVPNSLEWKKQKIERAKNLMLNPAQQFA